MKLGLCCAMMSLLAAAGVALGQAPAPAGPAPGGHAPVVVDAAPCCDHPAVADDGCGVDDTRLWVTPEYLLWKFKGTTVPPLQLIEPFSVTGFTTFTSSFSLPSGAGIDYDSRSGARLTAGYWLDPNKDIGIEASFFQFERKGAAFAAAEIADLPLPVTVIQQIPATTTTTPPINVTGGTSQITVNSNVLPAMQVPISVTYLAELNVRAAGSATPSNFWGTEVNARTRAFYFGSLSFDFLAGFRYLNFDEGFNLNEDITLGVANPVTFTTTGLIGPGTPPPLTSINTTLTPLAHLTTFDEVATRNRFYGAQVGASFEWWVCRHIVISGWSKFAVGGVYERVNIDGVTTTTLFTPPPVTAPAGTPSTPNAPVTTNSGLLTPGVGPIQDSRSRIAIIPEAFISVGYQITPNIRVFGAYNYLMFSDVARPGDQIGFARNTAQISLSGTPTTVTAVSPAFRFTESDFWAQGITGGLEIKY